MSNKIIEKYKEHQNKGKNKIKENGNHGYSGLGYGIAFPWVGLFYNIRDGRTAIIFTIVAIVLSSEVGVPYMIALICWNNEPLRIGMLSAASACWLFGLGPGTPFLVLCTSITMGVKALFNRIKRGNKQHEE